MVAPSAPEVPDSPTPWRRARFAWSGTGVLVAADGAHQVGVRHRVVHEAASEQLSGLGVIDRVFADTWPTPCSTPPCTWPSTLV